MGVRDLVEGVVFGGGFGVAGILLVLLPDLVVRVVLWVGWMWNFGVMMGFGT